MKITNAFIRQRLTELIKEKQQQNSTAKRHSAKLFTIKKIFPKFLRAVIFHPFNPFYAVFMQYKASKSKRKDCIAVQPLYPFAVDFFDYFLQNEINFDSSLYYPLDDEAEIGSYIDNRLMSLIPGYESKKMTGTQSGILAKQRELSGKIMKEGDWFRLSLEGKDYYLPRNEFGEHTYIHHYGLGVVPESVKKHIEGKDFLDVGAYLGDTAIFLRQNYAPSCIYAYEPVSSNAEQLKSVIEKNKADNIVLVAKGLSSEKAVADIYIDADASSVASINTAVVASGRKKESIQITTIDDECRNKTIGLIKMDIEGAEFSAIKGGLETIKRDKPVLLISLYHTGKDFFEIPPLLKEAVPEYCFRFVDLEILNPFTEKVLVAYPSI
ncbi:FkbM family methyltransferase [Dysgonomonas sp. 25]|uniref:FkbM family methyltransferase n=1 Tax=Dysgonomonas sp. 25 TaxID=2302933 RepID=UPI0013D13D5B|nr:FkbM family methyltransferase [Dysgonomonas sp. 25]NDV69645.1 FkbM family methyltransferase [Dysgonomonas sp. 25]